MDLHYNKESHTFSSDDDYMSYLVGIEQQNMNDTIRTTKKENLESLHQQLAYIRCAILIYSYWSHEYRDAYPLLLFTDYYTTIPKRFAANSLTLDNDLKLKKAFESDYEIKLSCLNMELDLQSMYWLMRYLVPKIDRLTKTVKGDRCIDIVKHILDEHRESGGRKALSMQINLGGKSYKINNLVVVKMMLDWFQENGQSVNYIYDCNVTTTRKVNRHYPFARIVIEVARVISGIKPKYNFSQDEKMLACRMLSLAYNGKYPTDGFATIDKLLRQEKGSPIPKEGTIELLPY